MGAAAAEAEAQPVADPVADAHYGHYGYGRSVVLPTLWGASYGHHYGKRAADALPEPVAGPTPLSRRQMLTMDTTVMVVGVTHTMAMVTTGANWNNVPAPPYLLNKFTNSHKKGSQMLQLYVFLTMKYTGLPLKKK